MINMKTILKSSTARNVTMTTAITSKPVEQGSSQPLSQLSYLPPSTLFSLLKEVNTEKAEEDFWGEDIMIVKSTIILI